MSGSTRVTVDDRRWDDDGAYLTFLNSVRRAVQSFIEVNDGMPVPRLEFVNTRTMPAVGSRDAFGQYLSTPGVGKAMGNRRRHGVVKVYVDNCLRVNDTRCVWSWPGYKSDLTALGVAAHELGHHVEHTMGKSLVIGAYRILRNGTHEEPLTTHGRLSPSEDFAESMKLYVTNPSLLSQLRPMRYTFIADNLGVRSAETRDWREVLASSPAHLEFLDQALSSGRPVSADDTPERL